jgi:hypothetical protein
VLVDILKRLRCARQMATLFCAMTTAMEVLFLGILFEETGDFAAPMVAGLLASAIEFACIRNRLQHGDRGPAPMK